MSNLILKPEIQRLVDENQEVRVRINRGVNKMMIFPNSTPKEDYPLWRDKGFRLFLCEGCKKERCICDDIPLTETTSKKETPKVDETKVVDNTDKLSQAKLYGVSSSGTNEEKEDDFSISDLEGLSLPDLRELYPDLKARSKKDFLDRLQASKA